MGALFLREGLLTQDQLEDALASQKQHFQGMPLGQVCIELGLLSEQQVESVLSKYSRRLPLGELLVHLGLISPSQLQVALAQQEAQQKKRKLGALLVEKRWLDNKALVQALYQQAQRTAKSQIAHDGKFAALVTSQRLTLQQLAAAYVKAHADSLPLETVLSKQYGLTKAELGEALSAFYQSSFRSYEPQWAPQAKLMHGLSSSYLKAQGWIPLRSAAQEVEVLLEDPHAEDKLQDIQRVFPGKTIRCAVGFREDIHKYVDVAHKNLPAQSSLDLVGELEQTERNKTISTPSDDVIDENDSVIMRLVNQLITEAYDHGASDIHIEPAGNHEETIIRFRVDGRCYDMLKVPATHRRALVSRLKIMAQLDISERRRPQDGKLYVRLHDRSLELRLATIPTAGSSNEDVVLRLLTARKPLPQ
jgi:type II secretory ATPase GspE/PulE/Tfp pilus assembly ATPase PilB-like protein